MSEKKLKKKGENIKLFFNHHLNIFPDDFFVTKNKKLIIYKNPYNEEDAKNDKIIEGYSTGRNSTTSNFRKSLKKLSNVVKFDRIFDKNKNFEFKQKDARSKFIKSKSLSDLDDKEGDKRQNLYNSMLAKKKINNNKKYYMNIYNNNKFKGVNIQTNELFKESSIKSNKKRKMNNNDYNYINNSKINLSNKKYISTEISKESMNSNYSRLTTQSFIPKKLEKNIPKKIHKIMKINTSSEIVIKYPKIKPHIKNKQYMITESEKNMKNYNDINKIIKRPSSSNKQNIKTKIKNTIDNIFVELSKNNEENKDILDKFNNLIRDVKNIQKVIKHKRVSISKNNINMKNN
jgi:hypothetical protein